MAGSKKGRKLRPYNTRHALERLALVCAHVLILTPEQIAADAWEHAPSTREMLDTPIDVS